MKRPSKYDMESKLTRALQRWGVVAFLGTPVVIFLAGFVVLACDANWDSGVAPPLFPDIFYHTLRLFTANLPSHGMENPKLPVLIVAGLAIIFTLGTLLQLFTAWMIKGVICFQRRCCRGRHVIICGLSRKAYHLAKAYTRAGSRVIVIDIDSQHPEIDPMLDLGVQMEFGDASDPQVLRNADIQSARLLVCLAGQEANARIQHTNVSMARKRQPVPAILHIEDRHLYKTLQEYEFSRPAEFTGGNVRFFNLADWGAEPLVHQETFSQAQPHYLIVGAGGLGQALVAGLTRKWRRLALPKDDKHIHFSLVDRDANEQVALLEKDYSALSHSWKLLPYAVEVRSAAFGQAAFLDPQDVPPISKVFICLGDDGLSLQASLDLFRAVSRADKAIEIHVRVAENEGLLWADYMKGQDKTDDGRLNAYRILEKVMTKNLEYACTNEQIAIALHAAYLKSMDKQVAEAKAAGRPFEVRPAMVPWETLSEAFRESNRAQAASIRDAFAALNPPREVRYHGPETLRLPLPQLSNAELNILAEREHERWMAEKVALGWSYGATRDDDRKLHPNLIPWDELDAATQQIDRDMVGAWVQALNDANMSVSLRQ